MAQAPSSQASRRAMTSAIDSLSVAEVRKFLGECRKKHQSQTLHNPMYITDVLSNGMTIQEFSLKFQQGHHQKRHNKVAGKQRPAGESDSSGDDDDVYFGASSDSEEDKRSKPVPPTARPPVTLARALASVVVGSSVVGSSVMGTSVVGSSVTGSDTGRQTSGHVDSAGPATKKRGRPKKTTDRDTSSPTTTGHGTSRSLLDYVKPPETPKVGASTRSKRKKISPR